MNIKEYLLVIVVALVVLAMGVQVAKKAEYEFHHPDVLIQRIPDGQSDPIEVALNNSVQHLANGKIAFEPPVKMKQSETKTVEVASQRI